MEFVPVERPVNGGNDSRQRPRGVQGEKPFALTGASPHPLRFNLKPSTFDYSPMTLINTRLRR